LTFGSDIVVFQPKAWASKFEPAEAVYTGKVSFAHLHVSAD
jgi:hypothetical protein